MELTVNETARKSWNVPSPTSGIVHIPWDGSFPRSGSFPLGWCISHGTVHIPWDGSFLPERFISPRMVHFPKDDSYPLKRFIFPGTVHFPWDGSFPPGRFNFPGQFISSVDKAVFPSSSGNSAIFNLLQLKQYILLTLEIFYSLR